MSPRSLTSLLLICVVVLCTGWNKAPESALRTGSLYLPLVQLQLPPLPEAGLLHSVGQAGAARAADDCSWHAGVLAWGWVAMFETTRDEQYWTWTQAWVDRCLAQGAIIAHVNDVPLAYAALAVYERDPQPRYWALAQQAAAYIFEAAPRTVDGTLIHLSDMVWVDTLFGVTPYLTKMWTVTGEARYLDEAVSQVQKHAAHLQDPVTGLYRHAWSEPRTDYSGPSFWGRGNGWALMAQAQLLAAVPADDARLPALLDDFRRQAQALLARQAADGMWHTVVPRSDFYLETSATALIAAGLAEAGKSNLFAAEFRDEMSSAAQAGRAAVWLQVGADGAVKGVSGPTGPMEDEAAYNTIPMLEFSLYGQGAALLAGAASR